MRISFDYNELISEIKADLKGKILKLTDEVQVQRGEYKQIVDWFYTDKLMDTVYTISAGDEKTEKEYKQTLQHYRANKPYLESMLVSNLLIELEENNNDK